MAIGRVKTKVEKSGGWWSVVGFILLTLHHSGFSLFYVLIENCVQNNKRHWIPI
jgi:hypothetical protein